MNDTKIERPFIADHLTDNAITGLERNTQQVDMMYTSFVWR